jgi:hypothetical protein
MAALVLIAFVSVAALGVIVALLALAMREEER